MGFFVLVWEWHLNVFINHSWFKTGTAVVTVCQLNKDAKTVTLYILFLLHSHIYVFFFFPLCLSQLCVSANFLQKRKEQDQRQFNILQPSFFSLKVFYMQLLTKFLYSDTTYYHKQVHLNLCITVLTFSTIHSSKKKKIDFCWSQLLVVTPFYLHTSKTLPP